MAPRGLNTCEQMNTRILKVALRKNPRIRGESETAVHLFRSVHPPTGENGAAIMPCDLEATLARKRRTRTLTELRATVEGAVLLALSALPEVRGDLEAVEARVTRALAAAMQAEADAYPKGERS